MKYNIENNIDFYKQLYDSLNDDVVDDDAGGPEVHCELCLISNLPLVNNFVELKCGHKFNYGPLYKDIFNYKKKFNNMEHLKTKLKQNQLRCPYCRNVQDELLPYHENFGYPKEHGVNFYDIHMTNQNYPDFVDPINQCQYQIITLDVSGNAHTHQCNHYGYIHSILKTKYNNQNKYCYNHRLIIVKEIVKEIKEKEKNEKAKKIEEKNKLKLELMKQKMELKNKKIEMKNNTDNNNSEHTINNNFCSIILKTGKQKGTQCSGKPYKVSLCKRHYNLQDKNNTNNTNNNLIISMDSEENEENIVIG